MEKIQTIIYPFLIVFLIYDRIINKKQIIYIINKYCSFNEMHLCITFSVHFLLLFSPLSKSFKLFFFWFFIVLSTLGLFTYYFFQYIFIRIFYIYIRFTQTYFVPSYIIKYSYYKLFPSTHKHIYFYISQSLLSFLTRS